MLNEIFSLTESKMEKVTVALEQELLTLRAGRATPALLDKISMDYYGTQTPIKQMANISSPEPRLLVIQPWDKNMLTEIERAILKSDLGITPANDGNIIRIAIPQLTEERRRELVRYVRKKTEEARVAVRNQRREANEQLKALEKRKEISEDERRKAQEKIQKITDSSIEDIKVVLEKKEKDIMDV